MPRRSSTTTTGTVIQVEANVTTTPASAAVTTMTRKDVESITVSAASPATGSARPGPAKRLHSSGAFGAPISWAARLLAGGATHVLGDGLDLLRRGLALE